MSTRDPIESLASYYGRASTAQADDDLLQAVYSARHKKTQRLLGAACGFSLGAAAATLLITMAARPVSGNGNATAAAIARYQMINSGLVDAGKGRGSLDR